MDTESPQPQASTGNRRLAVLNVVGLTSRFFDRIPKIQSALAGRDEITFAQIEPILPAVTSSVQATYLTGALPEKHGIVANGWYDRERCEHLFWKQSDRLVQGQKLWDEAKKVRPDFTCARLFWWNNMYSSVDYSITPRPIYCADGKKVFDVASKPMSIRDEIKGDLGNFPFPQFWGPGAGIESSQWIGESAKWIEERYAPSLNLVYLPHLDYGLQILGPDDPDIDRDLAEIDQVVGNLITFFENRGVEVVILSEYGITAVDRPVHLNRVFRQQGWLAIKDELGTDVLEEGDCQALAIADHQIAHVYVQDESIKHEVRKVLENTEGVGQVLNKEEQKEQGIAHDRSGDFVVVADSRSWFTYYFWMDDDRAPDYARTVDIHRKPGYDPVELFVDPDIANPKLKVGMKLGMKKLGMRTLMDLIPLDASLVKGSHGRKPESRDDWPVMIGNFPNLTNTDVLPPEEVFKHLLGRLTQK